MTDKLRWGGTALRRRFCLLALIILPSLLAARTMYLMLPHKGDENLELFMVGLFGVHGHPVLPGISDAARSGSTHSHPLPRLQ